MIGGAAAEARRWRGRSVDVDVTPVADESNLARLAAALNELDARLTAYPSSEALRKRAGLGTGESPVTLHAWGSWAKM